MSVRTRFAPSPTGFLHIGGLRTALFCWLYARRHAGQFVLRIEDTDLERSTEAAIQQIFDGMEWAGLEHDEGPFYQTKRFDRYKEVIEAAARRAAMPIGAIAPRRSSRSCAPIRWRAARSRATTDAGASAPMLGRTWPRSFASRIPLAGEVVVDDVVHGRVVFQNSELDDLIIARSDGTPTYNFCVVVDDMDMRITHVIRGDDHLNNTPRQMNMLHRARASRRPCTRTCR